MDIRSFKTLPILGILRNINKSQVDPVFEASIDANLAAIEITLNTPGAPALIAYASERYKDRISVGAGTVLSAAQAENAVKAGAEFIVSPNFNEGVSQFCRAGSIPFFPGALTPCEVYAAWQSGATMVKVFPASVFGPQYFRELLGPFDKVELMAVSGVTPDNLPEYFKCGAKAVAFGASVFRKEWLESKNWPEIKNAIGEYVKAYQQWVKK